MPGNTIAKAQRVTALVERFNEIAADFDKLLPKCYRYTGQPPVGDRRGDTWSNAVQYLITAGAALSELRDARPPPRGEAARSLRNGFRERSRVVSCRVLQSPLYRDCRTWKRDQIPDGTAVPGP